MKLIRVLLCMLILSSCTTGENMSDIKPGMSKEQVTKLLGSPDGYQRNGEYESLKYSNRLTTGWSWDRADYFVILQNDKVVEYGAGQVRSRGSNVLFLVPLQ